MDTSIFYSWQSDLPNNKNRGFIQSCIENAVKAIAAENIHLEIAVDRDTKDISGTPDIVSTIFSKIENANIFIADISIINSKSQERKTPNPNVLIELGFAAKTLGWNNIISLFNTEFGKVEELPFDLRFRRPLSYQIANVEDKKSERVKLTEILKEEILSILQKENQKGEIREYIKQQVDREILTICNQLYKILYGYEKKYTLDSIWQMVNLTENEIERELFERRHIGFTVLKDWKSLMQKLQESMNQPFFVQNAEQSFITSLIRVVNGLEMMSVVFSNESLFLETDAELSDYRVVDGSKMNSDNPIDSYLLTKEIADTGENVVIDFGTIRKFNLRRVKKILVIEDSASFKSVVFSIKQVLKGIDSWTSETGNQIIIDPLTFRV